MFILSRPIRSAGDISDKNRINRLLAQKYKRPRNRIKAESIIRRKWAFGIDNEGHNFSRATRGYTPHKICLHSWETPSALSRSAARATERFDGRRDTGAAIDQHPRNFINRKERGRVLEDSSSFRVYPDCPPCFIDTRLG